MGDDPWRQGAHAGVALEEGAVAEASPSHERRAAYERSHSRRGFESQTHFLEPGRLEAIAEEGARWDLEKEEKTVSLCPAARAQWGPEVEERMVSQTFEEDMGSIHCLKQDDEGHYLVV